MSDQARWDSYGTGRAKEITADPERFQISGCPSNHRAVTRDLADALGDLSGKKVLDLGCGHGKFAVWMAKQGASVFAVDLGPTLLEAAEALARANGVACEFRQGNITHLPFDEKFDVVTGLAILHHLSPKDVKLALLECHRVLKTGGTAYFFEPVENSRIFEFLQNLIPAGGQRPRPSILQRRKWADYLAALDDRAMSNRELEAAGEPFSRVTFSHHGFFVRLSRIIGQREALLNMDEVAMKIPGLRRYSQAVLVSYIK